MPIERNSRLIRSLAGLFCIVFATVVTGCSADGGSTSGAVNESTELTLRVGIDPSFAPYVFEENGAYVGSEVDIAKALGEEMHMKVELNKIGFDALISGLQGDRIDMALVGGWKDGPERRQAMNMIAYYEQHHALLVEKGVAVNSLSELCGKTVSTLAASIFVSSLESANSKCKDAGQPEIDILQLSESAAVLAVKNGRSYANLDEGALAAYTATKNPDLQMNELQDFAPYNAAIGMSKTNSALAEKVKTAMQALRDSGKLADIQGKWGIPESWLLPTITLNGE